MHPQLILRQTARPAKSPAGSLASAATLHPPPDLSGFSQPSTVVAPKLVWDSFGSWLRTIRPGIPPSELVVAQALRQTLPDFLLVSCKVCALAKFIADRQDTQNMRIFRLTA